jgi:hypothetical protein
MQPLKAKHMNPLFKPISLVLLIVFSRPACAHENCSAAEAIKAETESSSLESWDALHRAYNQYKQCDDGAIAEGYSDTVARLLTRHWASVSELDAIARKDAGFRNFVIRHIDSLMSPSEAKTILANAFSKCPSGSNELCRLIRKRIDRLDDSQEILTPWTSEKH